MSIVAEKAAGSGEASGPSEGAAAADTDGEAPAAEDGEAEGLTAWLADCEKAGATFVPPQEAATKAHAQAATEIGCIRRGGDAGIRAVISCSDTLLHHGVCERSLRTRLRELRSQLQAARQFPY